MSGEITQQGLYETMRADFAQRTGVYMENDDDLAVRLWAVAAQLAALYSESKWCYRQAFPQTAEGENLDRHGQMRALSRRAGVCARGTLRLFVAEAQTSAIDIAAGTVCTDAGLVRFVTTEDARIAVGETYVNVPAQAVLPGSTGNAKPGTITFLTRPPVSIVGVTNPETFTGGIDREDDETFRARILDSYRRLPNGANAAWYEARVLEIEGVAAVSVLPRWNGIGTVGVVIAGADGSADEALLETVQAVLDEAREIATDVTVMAAETVTVPVTAQIQVRNGCNASAVLLAVRTAITQHFDGRLLGKPVYRATLGQILYSIEGVENYQLTAPSADVAIDDDQLPVLGTLTVTEATA